MNTTPWIRHEAAVQQNASSFTIYCLRCGVTLPQSALAGEIVCQKDDRWARLDIQQAEDCRL
jgi:hypothetical protein